MTLNLKAFITGLAGPHLLDEEKAFVRAERPCGLILFDRNIEDKEQLRRLIGDYREAVDSPTQLILLDQEGGRIQRMRAPHWKVWPAAARYGELYQQDKQAAIRAAQLVYRMMTDELVEMGFNVNCVPLLDIPVSGSHDIIGDRALSNDIGAIIELGRAVANGNLQGGVLPVIKHIPGHGRATADSHVNLPVIDATRQELEQSDFQTFKALNDLPLAMTGHLLMSDLDPKLNVSVSKTIIDEVIRGFIGFDGCLMSDDLSMEALSGTLGERARDVLAAGCDLALYCKGEREQMLDVAANTPELAGKAGARFTAAITCLQPPQPFDEIEAKALLARLS